MEAAEHRDVVAVVDGVEARVLHGDDGVADAVDLLDRAEERAGAPLVDESERARLTDLAAGDQARGDHWHSVLARRGERAVGYAAVVLPNHGAPDPVAHGDVAIDRLDLACEPPLTALLRACDVLARRHGTRRLQVWLRHAGEADVRCAAAAGYAVDRRLGVLSHPLVSPPPADADHAGVTIRAFADGDEEAVVDVLAAAYDGTPDGGWTAERLAAKRSFDWFDPADLLVAVDPDGSVPGVHWTKRRGDAVGEVYNLAVHPDAQGRGLGAVLLAAGLAHLHDVGCREVILWVDLANERAVRLYTSQGFTVAWEDLALGRELVGGQSSPRRRSAGGTSL